MWDMRTVQVIPIAVGSLGSVTKNLDKWLEKLDKRISISLFKKLRYQKLNSKDFKERFGVNYMGKEVNSKGPLVMGYDSLPQQVNRYEVSQCTKQGIIITIIIIIINTWIYVYLFCMNVRMTLLRKLGLCQSKKKKINKNTKFNGRLMKSILNKSEPRIEYSYRFSIQQLTYKTNRIEMTLNSV